ncbi:MAG: hypothetical protein IKH15_12455 [Bacteroidales bacterium]|nr:hypothetical protein [Bacteroidales bacterium]
MKKTLLLAFALMLSAVMFAQQQLATLNHNNNITYYYGLNALISAHTDAVNGDVITLSSGVFNATDITKAVTIRGAGAWADTTGSNTMIRNNFNINIPEDSEYHLTMEGIYAYNIITCQQVYNPQFIKCNFQSIGSSLRKPFFVNCILVNWTSGASGAQFVNSVVMNTDNYTTNDVYVNCVVRQNPENATSRMFRNCVLYYDYAGASTPSNNSSTSFNCLFVQMSAADGTTTGELFAPLENNSLWNIRGMENAFKTFNGSTAGKNFELLESVASTCIGTDGTQIGIYGGPMPFNPRVTNSLVKRIQVASRSNADEKLPVNIELGE